MASPTSRAGDYYRVIGDRLLWGGRISTSTAIPRRLKRKLARDIAQVYPTLKGVEIEHAWSGIMGYAVHRMPQIGMLRPGAWIASAFGGHGLNTTAMAGELIDRAIGTTTRMALLVRSGWCGRRRHGRANEKLAIGACRFDKPQNDARRKERAVARRGSDRRKESRRESRRGGGEGGGAVRRKRGCEAEAGAESYRLLAREEEDGSAANVGGLESAGEIRDKPKKKGKK